MKILTRGFVMALINSVVWIGNYTENFKVILNLYFNFNRLRFMAADLFF